MPLSPDFMRQCHDIRRRTMDNRPRSLWARVKRKCHIYIKALCGRSVFRRQLSLIPLAFALTAGAPPAQAQAPEQHPDQEGASQCWVVYATDGEKYGAGIHAYRRKARSAAKKECGQKSNPEEPGQGAWECRAKLYIKTPDVGCAVVAFGKRAVEGDKTEAKFFRGWAETREGAKAQALSECQRWSGGGNCGTFYPLCSFDACLTKGQAILKKYFSND